MQINIDNSAGFCWGVVKTIDLVEDQLREANGRDVYVLGQIIHNPKEIERLEAKGLKTITHEDLPNIKKENSTVIIRAHGEPPSTYDTADKLGLDLVDATCPLVTSLQKRVRKYHKMGYQIVVYGKENHAEVIGLRGVCNDECIVIKSLDDALEKVDFNKKTVLFTQTTMNKYVFYEIRDALKENAAEFHDEGEIKSSFMVKDTICKYVSDRDEDLRKFARTNDLIIFVAGRSSSNGKSLFQICSGENPNTKFIESIEEIDYTWFDGVEKVGVTGATSTPQWYLRQVKDEVEKNYKVPA